MRKVLVTLCEVACWLLLATFAIVLFIDRNVAYYSYDANVPIVPNIALLVVVVAVATIGWLIVRHLGEGGSDGHPRPGEGEEPPNGRHFASPVPSEDATHEGHGMTMPRRVLSLMSRWDFVIVPAVLLVIQLVTYALAGFAPGWDAGTVEQIALVPAPLGDHLDMFWSTYPARYPNNLFIIWVMRSIEAIRSTLFPFVGSYAMFAITACIATSASVGLAMRVADRLIRSPWAKRLCVALLILLVGLSPWFLVPYTDTYGLLACTLSLWFLSRPGHPWVRWGVGGLIAMVSFAIKPTAIFCPIAFVVSTIMVGGTSRSTGGAPLGEVTPAGSPSTPKGRSRLVATLLAVILPLSAGLIAGKAMTSVASASLGVTWESEAEFTIHHYLMMGLNDKTDGSFVNEDVEFSASQPDVRTRKEADMAVASDRAKAYGIGGILRLWLHKTLMNYNDGTFSWGREGGFIATTKDTHGALPDLIRSWWYPGGSLSTWFVTVQQCLWVATLGFVPMCLIGLRRRDADGECPVDDGCLVLVATMLASIVALSAFLIVFEARARYMFLYAPFFVLLAGWGIECLGSVLSARHGKPIGSGIEAGAES